MQSILRDETVFLYRFSDISLKFWFSRQFYESGNVALFWRERTPRNREGGHVSSVEIQILSRTLACSDIIARVNSSPSFYDVWELRPLIFISTHQETKGEHSVILSRVWIPRHHFMMREHWGFEQTPDVSIRRYYRVCEFLAIILWCGRTEGRTGAGSPLPETKGGHPVILSCVLIPRHHFMMREHWGFE